MRPSVAQPSPATRYGCPVSGGSHPTHRGYGQPPGPATPGSALEPRPRRRVLGGSDARPDLEVGATLGYDAVALGQDVVVVDRLVVHLAGQQEAPVRQVGVALERARDHEP